MVNRKYTKYGLRFPLCYVISLLLLGGCASEQQKTVTREWFDVSDDVIHNAGTKNPLIKVDILAQLGPPDLCISAEDWRKALPNTHAQSGFLNGMYPPSVRQLLDQHGVKDTIRIMFYDEHKRYFFPSNPTWGMGMGWVLIGFVLDGDTVVGASRLSHPKPQLVYNDFTQNQEEQ